MGLCVSGGSHLLTEEAVQELRCDARLAHVVRDMRVSERHMAERLQGVDVAQVQLACRDMVVELLEGQDFDGLGACVSADSFARSVYALRGTPLGASARRKAREVARVYALMCAGGIPLPRRVEEFRDLWEVAMDGEPRWSPDYPTSAFRTRSSHIYDSLETRVIVRINAEPGEIAGELGELLRFLSDESVLPEVRAVAAFAAFEFTHPFSDGNGHTGRMLMLSALQEGYSLFSMTCFSRALILGREEAARLFSLLRGGECSLAAFCLSWLGHLCEVSRGARCLNQKGILPF